MLIRLAEMYYVLAECAADAQTAAGYLNAVREARGVDPTGLTEATRLNEIEKEYRKEFYGEGQLFFLYKRLDAAFNLNGTMHKLSRGEASLPLPVDQK